MLKICLFVQALFFKMHSHKVNLASSGNNFILNFGVYPYVMHWDFELDPEVVQCFFLENSFIRY